MIRALGGAALAGVALSVAVQAAPAVVSPELAQKVVWGMLAGAGTLVVTIVGVLVKKVIDFFINLQAQLTSQLGVVKQIMQEVYGPTGTNGLRGDVHWAKSGIQRHDRELDFVCRELGIERLEQPG